MIQAMNRRSQKGLKVMKVMRSPYKKYLFFCIMFVEVVITMVNGKGIHQHFIQRPILSSSSSSSSSPSLAAFLPMIHRDQIQRQGCHHRSPIISLPFINERNKEVLNQNSAVFLKSYEKGSDDHEKLLIDMIPIKIVGNTNVKKKKKEYTNPKSLGDMIPLSIKGVGYNRTEKRNNGKDSKSLQDMIPMKTKGGTNTKKLKREKKYGNDSKSLIDMIPITSKEDSITNRKKKNHNNNEQPPISQIQTKPEKDDDAFKNDENDEIDQ